MITVKPLVWEASPVHPYKGKNWIHHSAKYHEGEHSYSLYQYADYPEDQCVYVGNHKVSLAQAKAHVQARHEQCTLSDLVSATQNAVYEGNWGPDNDEPFYGIDSSVKANDYGMLERRYKALCDWYLRGGSRSEIHEFGHIQFTTQKHIDDWADSISATKDEEKS